MIDYFKADKKTIEEYSSSLELKNQNIQEFLENERDEFQKEIYPLYAKLRSREPSDLIDLQSDYLNLRQKAMESMNKYLAKLGKENALYNKIAADRMEYYSTGFGLKTTNGERTQFIDRDLREQKRRVLMLENHIDFLRDIGKSCDQIGYAVKNRVALMNFMQ